MANVIDYPDPEYKENIEGSKLFLRRSCWTAPIVIITFFGGVVLLWATPSICSALGVSEGSNTIPRVMMLMAFIIVVVGISWSTRFTSKPFSSCLTCSSKMKVENHKGCEFFVCKNCKTFVRGGDDS